MLHVMLEVRRNIQGLFLKRISRNSIKLAREHKEILKHNLEQFVSSLVFLQ
jgi:hypothetical protein